MKISIFFVLFILSATVVKGQTVDDANKFAKKIIQAFQQKDYTIIKALLVTPKIYRDEIWPLINKDLAKHHAKMAIDGQGSEFYLKGQIDTLNRKIFSDIIKEGTKLGILNWNEVKFDSLKIEGQATRNIDYPFLNGYIYFSYRTQSFIIIGLSATKTSVGYRMLYVRGLMPAPKTKLLE